MTTPTAAADASATSGASRWTVVLCALVGLGLGLVLFAVRSPSYQAEVLVEVANPTGTMADEIALVTSPDIIDVAETLAGVRPDVTVTAAEVTNQLTIRATADDAEDAAAAANAVASTYVQAQAGSAATIAEPADVPSSASGFGPFTYALIGMVLGGLIGLLAATLRGARAPSKSPTPSRAEWAGERFHSQIAEAAASSTQPPTPFPSLQVPRLTTPKSSSFSDAANTSAPALPEPAWLADPSAQVSIGDLTDLDRRAIQTRNETERYELVLAHDEQLASRDAEHERATSELRAQVASLEKQVRIQGVRLKNRSGNDQSRTGDLEAQVDALEVELAEIRQTLEAERIAHTRRVTDDSEAADRALDNTRREFREELAKHVHTHRQTIAEFRTDLDQELAQDRARHAASLEEQHVEYERQIESERARVDAKIAAANERSARDIETLRAAHRNELDRQAAQHKATISSLRDASETNDAELRESEKSNRLLRAEVSSLQKQARHARTDHDAVQQRLNEELALLKTELEGERQRNAALRADVLRRSAEAHQAIDRAVEERTAQLAELEASVGRQRQYADTRVREVSAAAEEQARQAATREAALSSTISRLKRELAEAQRTS